MLQTMFSTARPLSLAILFAFIAACGAHSPTANAQVDTDIPVLVMGLDHDPNSVKRSSNIFKRVFGELRQSMAWEGYRIIDEDSVAVDLGWTIPDRRPKAEVLDFIKTIAEATMLRTRCRSPCSLRFTRSTISSPVGAGHWSVSRERSTIPRATSNWLISSGPT